ncbi:hypothetical protein BC628DRAFT_1313243, partial [Trametes gibbosa]
IKYLRVPDTLLDAVGEGQSRAREAGRSKRGAHVSGTGYRGRDGPPQGKSRCTTTHPVQLTCGTGPGGMRGGRGGRGRSI